MLRVTFLTGVRSQTAEHANCNRENAAEREEEERITTNWLRANIYGPFCFFASRFSASFYQKFQIFLTCGH